MNLGFSRLKHVTEDTISTRGRSYNSIVLHDWINVINEILQVTGYNKFFYISHDWFSNKANEISEENFTNNATWNLWNTSLVL